MTSQSCLVSDRLQADATVKLHRHEYCFLKQFFALTVQVCYQACYSYNIAVPRAAERVLDFDGVTSVALALCTTGTLVATRAFPVLAVAAALSLASLAGGAGAIRATIAVVTTVAL